jgi:hypothetical protein
MKAALKRRKKACDGANIDLQQRTAYISILVAMSWKKF